MKVEIEQLEPCKRVLKIEVPVKVVDEELDAVYEEIKKAAQIPGFRKGKAPRQLLERYHSKQAKDEVLKRLIPSTYEDVVKEHNLFPVSLPEITQVKFVDNQPLYFEATVDVKPDAKIKKYKGLTLKKKKFELKDEEVEGALNLLRERYAEYKTIDSRPIKDDDYVIADYECQVEGKTIDKQDKAWFYINYDTKQPKDIIDKLKGANIDQEIEVNVTLPKDYLKAEFAGKEALFRLKVKEIKEKSLPSLDEEFVKNLGDYKSLAELKDAVKNDLEVKKQHDIKLDIERQVSEILLKLNPMEVPSSMVTGQTEELIKNAKSRLLFQGLKMEDINAREDELRENLKNEAEKQTKMYFILNEIANIEGINCEEEDLKLRIEQIAKQNRTDTQKIREYLDKQDSLESLKGQIRHEKVMDFLIKEARIQ